MKLHGSRDGLFLDKRRRFLDKQGENPIVKNIRAFV
jgi:hypothetical protein